MKQGPPGYLKTVFTRYDELSRKAVLDWRTAMEEIRKGTYEPKDCVNKWLYFWTEGTLAWWTPWIAAIGTPEVQIRFRNLTDEWSGETQILADPGDTLFASQLVPLQQNSPEIPAANVKVKLEDDGEKLVVTLEGLDGLNPAPNANDRFMGVVFDPSQTAVAAVRAVYLPQN